MSSYHTSFTYLNQNSQDKHLILASFEPDNGFVESFLSMDSIYDDSYNGNIRHSYGAKYNSVATIKITLIKDNNEVLSLNELRYLFKWLTGSRKDTWMDMYNSNELQYSFLGKITDVQQYKIDSKCIGIMLIFTSVSPWAYSPLKKWIISTDKNSNKYLENNLTDDLYSDIYLDVIIKNQTAKKIEIQNESLGESVIVNNIKQNEIIKISSNQFIISDSPGRIFDKDFNFIFPRLIPGNNIIYIISDGIVTIEFSYRYPIKIGDCAIDIKEVMY